MIHNLIFDFDGTILQSFPLAIKTLNEAGEKFKLPRLTNATAEGLRDLSIPEIFKSLKIPFWTLPFLVRWARKKMKSEIHNMQLVPGLNETFQELKSSGYNLFVLTSNSKQNVKLALEDNKIIHLFDDIIGGIATFSKKGAMKRLIKKKDLKLEECVYISDEVRDIHATNELGMKNIAVTWGYNSEKALMGANPNHVAHTAEELFRIIVELK